MDRKTAEHPRTLREVLDSIPEEHFKSVWSCFLRPVLIALTPTAIASAKKALQHRLSGQESLFEDEEVEDKDIVQLTVFHNIMRCDRNGELAALIQEHRDWAKPARPVRVEPPDEWNCSSCRRSFPKGIDGAPCPCGSRSFTATPPGNPAAAYGIRV